MMTSSIRLLLFFNVLLVFCIANISAEAVPSPEAQDGLLSSWNILRVRSVPNVLSARKVKIPPHVRKMRTDADISHGVLMGCATAFFLPLGAIVTRLMRGKNTIWVHVGLQTFGMITLIGGFATGVWTSINHDEIYTDPHTSFGTVIFAFFLLQPLFGWMHHIGWIKKQRQTVWSHLHIWFGRIILILAIVNCGIGIQYAENSVKGEIAYGVVSGVIGLAYICIVTWWYWSRSQTTLDANKSGGSSTMDFDGDEKVISHH